MLTELIEQHFYRSYLPDSANEQIRAALQLQFPEASDFKVGTAEFKRYERVRKELEAVHQNRLFNDSAQFETIYLDTDFRRGICPFTLPSISTDEELPVVFIEERARISSLFSQVVRSDTAGALSLLNTLQSNISPTDF